MVKTLADNLEQLRTPATDIQSTFKFQICLLWSFTTKMHIVQPYLKVYPELTVAFGWCLTLLLLCCA